MADVKANEREFNSEVISWLNEFMSGGSYPFDKATGETSVKVDGETTKFPDIQIWQNRAAKQGFCGWELKPPAIAADDTELLANAASKARAMGADYFLTWNMRSAILWRTPQAGETVSAFYIIEQYPAIPYINKPDDMLVKSNEIRLKALARDILDDLKRLYYDHTLNHIEADTTFFVRRLYRSVEVLNPTLSAALSNRVGGDAVFRQKLQAWGTKQGIVNVNDADFHTAVAKQIIYRLLVRIIFYITLQRQWRNLPELSLTELDSTLASRHLKEVFAIARSLDWHAVFEEGLPDEIELPDAAIHEIDALLKDLNRFSFSHMPHDVIGAVFEQLIPQPERHTLGQYFTPENLVDLILAFCVRQRDDKVLDPTCGTGTFLLRAYNKEMCHLGLADHKQLLRQIWGIDIAHFPSELATINLFRQDLTDYHNFPRILVKDFFDVKPGDTYDFPPPKVNPEAGFEKVKEPIPQFDAAVGNFPFIRQELIEKAEKGYKNRIENVIKADWLAEYPEAFNIPGKQRDAVLAEIKRNPSSVLYDAELNLSGQADIYAYLYFHAGRFVKEGGRMGFITSNSWLDVAYGYELQKYMVNNFKIIAIMESRCEPWFEDAAVNTVVTILERCSDKAARDQHITAFVKVKKKLAELIPWDPKLETINRWTGLEGLARKVTTAAVSNCYSIDGQSMRCTLEGVKTAEDDDFRIRLVKQSDLKAQLDSEHKTAKWGQYLRAPQVYFDLLNEYSDKFVPLWKVADIEFGIKTGINEFFHLDENKIGHWNIEPEFLVPIITTAKEVEGLAIKPEAAEYKLFLCNKSKEQLKIQGKLNALKYIEWGEKQTTKDGIYWPKVPSVKGRLQWYSLGEVERGDIMINRFVAQRFFIPTNTEQTVLGDVVFEGVFKNKQNKIIGAVLANTAITALSAELTGRVNLGEGLLTTYGPEIVEFLIPNPEQISKENANAVLKSFATLAARPVKPIFEEVRMKDRQKLDRLVLEAIGLDPAKYLHPIYDGLTELVRERIELAGMRKKQKQSKVMRDLDKLVAQVTEDIVNEGIKKFPDDFVRKRLKAQDRTNIAVPGTLLKVGLPFFTQHEIIGENYKYLAPGLAAAKYIVYAHRPDEYIVGLPNEEALVTQAVIDYERYLKDVFQKLNKDLHNRLIDYKQAETLARRISQELGLPLVA